jgi:hypothetical protein
LRLLFTSLHSETQYKLKGDLAGDTPTHPGTCGRRMSRAASSLTIVCIRADTQHLPRIHRPKSRHQRSQDYPLDHDHLHHQQVMVLPQNAGVKWGL